MTCDKRYELRESPLSLAIGCIALPCGIYLLVRYASVLSKFEILMYIALGVFYAAFMAVIWLYPDRLVMDEEGVHFHKPFLRKEKETVYLWRNIATCHFEWIMTSATRRPFFDMKLFVLVCHDGAEITIPMRSFCYSSRRFMEAVERFSGGRCRFDREQTARNRRRHLLRAGLFVLAVVVLVVLSV